MNPQYEILAKCLLPTHMLEWFELTNVVHLYLDENELTRSGGAAACAPSSLA